MDDGGVVGAVAAAEAAGAAALAAAEAEYEAEVGPLRECVRDLTLQVRFVSLHSILSQAAIPL